MKPAREKLCPNWMLTKPSRTFVITACLAVFLSGIAFAAPSTKRVKKPIKKAARVEKVDPERVLIEELVRFQKGDLQARKKPRVSKVPGQDSWADYWAAIALDKDLKNLKASPMPLSKAKLLKYENWNNGSSRFLAQFAQSAWLKKVREWQIDADFSAADTAFKIKDYAVGFNLLTRGFDRLGLGNGQIQGRQLLTKSVADLFSQFCSVTKDSLILKRCSLWAWVLVDQVGSNSPAGKLVMGRLKSLIGDFRSSKISSKQTQNYSAPDPDLALFDEAFDDYSHDRNGKGEEKFRKILQDFPRSAHRHRARYWLGHCLVKAGKEPESRLVWAQVASESPMTWYGLRAAELLNQDPRLRFAAELPVELNGNPDWRGFTPAQLERVERLQSLAKVAGAGEFLSLEADALVMRSQWSDAQVLQVASVVCDGASYRLCFQTLGELIQRGSDAVYTSWGRKRAFPRPFLDSIEEVAKREGLDPWLVIGLIKQESAFEAGVRSSANAQGLMQLMPATALEVNPALDVSDLQDPKTNIETGAKYLKMLLTQFKGNVPFALAAYNAGPHRVKKWVEDKRHEGGMEFFMERIPFKETRDYVASIMRNYYWYYTENDSTLVARYRFLACLQTWSVVQA